VISWTSSSTASLIEQRRGQSIYQQTGTADRRRQLQDVLLGSGVRLLNDHKAKMLQHPAHLHHPMCSYSLKEIADYAGTSTTMIEPHYCAKQELDPDRKINVTQVTEEVIGVPDGI
jgi:hypothetical protein